MWVNSNTSPMEMHNVSISLHCEESERACGETMSSGRTMLTALYFCNKIPSNTNGRNDLRLNTIHRSQNARKYNSHQSERYFETTQLTLTLEIIPFRTLYSSESTFIFIVLYFHFPLIICPPHAS